MTTRETFGTKLRAEFDARGIGARTLARMLVDAHGGDIEVRRRAIIKWLRGATPVERNRHLVENVLGVARDSLKGDDDEEDRLLPIAVSIDYDLLARALEARLARA